MNESKVSDKELKEAQEAAKHKPAKPVVATTTQFPRIDPRTGQPVQYQEVADTSSTTPESERILATSGETHARFLKNALLRILAVHGAAEANINWDHEYWHLKEVYAAIPPSVPVP
jgi:hypothetical protein